MTRRIPVTAAVALALALGGLFPGAAFARSSMIYAEAAAREALLDAGLGTDDGLLEQHPARGVFDGGARAWKVTGRTGTSQTPSLAGLSAEEMADVLRDRINRSGAHLVFLDELGGGFRGDRGDRLAAALESLAGEESPWGGRSMAERVHIYVPGPRGLLAQPDLWAGAWAALARAGGVWLEAYTGGNDGSPRPWTVEQWLAWPRAFRDLGMERAVDPARLHLLLTSGDQERQFALARTGGSCPYVGNGLGSYRIGPVDAVAFAQQFRALYGSDPAPEGASPVECFAAPAPPPGAIDRLRAALARQAGITVPRSVWPGRLWVGISSRRELDLGADPAEIAARLGVEPQAFWGSAGARIVTRGAGTAAAAPVMADGTAEFSYTPTEPGTVRMWLEIPGAALIGALAAEPFDVVAALAPHSPELGALARQMVVRPASWRLVIPLSPREGAPSAPIGIAEAPPPEHAVAKLYARRAGLAERKVWAGRRNARRWSMVVVTGKSADGRPVPRARLVINRPWAAEITARTSIAGKVRVWVPSRGGSLEARTFLGRASAGVALPGRPPAGTRLALVRLGRAAVSRRGRNATTTLGLVAVVRGPGGSRGNRVRLVVRRPGMRVKVMQTDRRGRAFVPVIRRHAGMVRVRVARGAGGATLVVCGGELHRPGSPGARRCG